jgi:hypothetical protein
MLLMLSVDVVMLNVYVVMLSLIVNILAPYCGNFDEI